MRVVLAALVLAAAAALAVTLDHAREDVYYVPGYGIAIAVAAFAAVLAGALVVSRAARRGNQLAMAAGPALLIVGGTVLAVIALQRPLVDCETGRAGENVFLGLESAEGGGTSYDYGGGRLGGRLEGEGYSYDYACENGRLVRFELRTS